MKEYFAGNLAPMLAPNKVLGIDIPFKEIKWPKLVSTKYNGIRGINPGGRDKPDWKSRTGKDQLMAPHVREIFRPLLEYSYDNRVVLDGEFHSNSHNTVGQTKSILAGTLPMPADFMFKCFYEVPQDIWNTRVKAPMRECIPTYDPGLPRLKMVSHQVMNSLGEFQNHIEQHKSMNLEGFMLLDPNAMYKHSARCTVREQILLKYKYYSDPEDGKVIGLVPRQERVDGVEGRTNAFGYAEQVYTKESFQDTDIAGCMIVQLESGEIIHAPFPIGYTLERRQMIHLHFGKGLSHDIKNTWISFRRLSCENRDKPIAIKGVEFRDSKD